MSSTTLPTVPGKYKDRVGDIWTLTADGKWKYRTSTYDLSEVESYAPYELVQADNPIDQGARVNLKTSPGKTYTVKKRIVSVEYELDNGLIYDEDDIVLAPPLKYTQISNEQVEAIQKALEGYAEYQDDALSIVLGLQFPSEPEPF